MIRRAFADSSMNSAGSGRTDWHTFSDLEFSHYSPCFFESFFFGLVKNKGRKIVIASEQIGSLLIMCVWKHSQWCSLFCLNFQIQFCQVKWFDTMDDWFGSLVTHNQASSYRTQVRHRQMPPHKLRREWAGAGRGTWWSNTSQSGLNGAPSPPNTSRQHASRPL